MNFYGTKDLKIQIREICDIRKNKYKIYDLMKKDVHGNWKGKKNKGEE